MMQSPIIPHDVAEQLQRAESVMKSTVQRLERLHMLYGDGAEDTEFDDGEIHQWEVCIEHGEVERLIENLRNIGEFAGWLANFNADAEPSEMGAAQ